MSDEWKIRGKPPRDLEVIAPSGVDLIKLLPVAGLTLEVDPAGAKLVIVCQARHLDARVRGKGMVRVEEDGKPRRYVQRIELANGDIIGL